MPCGIDPSEFVHFRKRIGPEALEMVLSETVRLHEGTYKEDALGIGKGEIGDDNNPLLAAIGFCQSAPKGSLWERIPLEGHPLGNLRSKYNHIA